MLAHRSSDGPGRPVVFVHGNSSSSRTWLPLLDTSFGTRYRCFAPDLPGHGRSAPRAEGVDGYSVPGYAAAVADFITTKGLQDAVVVGWSLGGHAVIEAAPTLDTSVAGYVIFGTPPIEDAASFARAYLPNPAMGHGFRATLTPAEAREYAVSFVAAHSAVPLDDLVSDILATDPDARGGLGASVSEGRFVNEADILSHLTRPIAILHGAEESLVSVDYLKGLAAPTLWRDSVQSVEGAGHAIHLDRPEALADLLEAFITDLPPHP
ncbi:alpha/beta hydrolase [Streptomyces sp. NPDC026672]|uniref:alpha/beta fold hydrolase n=1 Tax=unclassified Streptomyces TaxID=2593676 RepID=UPI0033F139CD